MARSAAVPYCGLSFGLVVLTATNGAQALPVSNAKKRRSELLLLVKIRAAVFTNG
jgi:hypothetical protein